MSNDPNIYRSPVRTIGNVEDEAATNSTDGWSIPSLLKGIYHLLSGTITVTAPVGGATAANQATEITSLTSIDGHVDGLETLVGATNTALSTIDGHVDGLEALIASSNTKLDTVHTDLGTLATQTTAAAILAKLSADPATQTTLAAVLAKLNSSVAVTGTFWQATQPISGTVAATQSGAWSLTANQSVNAAQINGVTPLMGNGVTGTGSQRVTIASDNTAFSVNAVQSGTWNVGTVTTVSTVTNLSQLGGAAIAMGSGVRSTGTQRVTIATDDVVPASQSGAWTVTANAGTGTMAVSLASVPSHAVTNAGTFAVQSAVADGANVAEGAVADAVVAAGASGSISAKLRAISRDLVANIVLAAGSAIIGKVGIDQTSGQNIVKTIRSATGTQSSVASSATDVTILASNASRLGASIYNDSTAILYLLLANATSSSTTHSVQMQAGAYFEVPAQYTGVIKGIWASANGSARVTELT